MFMDTGGGDLGSLTETDRAIYETYGILYNQPAALTACPPGTHLPTDEEWHTLESFFATAECKLVNGYRCSPAGAKLKDESWGPQEGVGESGFDALPAGIRRAASGSSNGDFAQLDSFANFWMANSGVNRYLSLEDTGIYRNSGSRARGFSVRCVQ